MRISDWSSDVCSSDLIGQAVAHIGPADAIALVPLKRNRVAVIADAQVQPAIFLMRSDSGRDRTGRTGTAIFYSIFNKRLQDQAWNAGAHNFGRNIYAGDEASRKPAESGERRSGKEFMRLPFLSSGGRAHLPGRCQCPSPPEAEPCRRHR